VASPCDSIQVARDTIQYQVYATLDVPTEQVYDRDGKLHQDTISDDFRGLVLQAIRQSFVHPAQLPLNVYLIVPGLYPPVATPAVFGEAVFSLTPTGGLAESQLVQSSLSPAVDQSLMDALRRADSANLFPLPSEAKAKVTRLYVTLGSSQIVPKQAVQLFAVRVPVWHDVIAPRPDPAHSVVKPTYPTDLLDRGFVGSVYMDFVIDEHGRVVPSTIAVLRAEIRRASYVPHRDWPGHEAQLSDFVTAILPSVRNGRYLPGTIDRCPVKSFVIQPFAFDIRH